MRTLLILFSFIAVLFFSCKNDENKNHELGTYVATSPILLDTIIYKDYVGQIHSIQHIELRTLERGYLQQINVDEGQYVKKGQLLFQIMPILNEAEVQKAQAEVNFALIEFQNTKALADSNIVSTNELALAKATLQKAQAELYIAQAHLNFTQIKAPFDGIIGRFNDVRLGSLVDEGELLTTLSDNSKMWVYFNVPEAEYLDYASRPKSKDLRQVKLKLANNAIFSQSGVIETIEADFNNETGNIAFRASFSNPDGLLRNGETGNILMPVLLKQALLMPQQATFEILDKRYVYVVDQAGNLRSQEIKIGCEIQHIYEVIDGLREEERILIEGLRKVKNGDHISVEIIDQRTFWSQLGHLHAE